MTLVLSFYALMVYAKILITKFDRKTMFLSSAVILGMMVLTFSFGKRTAAYNLIYFMTALHLAFSLNQNWTVQLRRKFYTLPAIIFQLPLLAIPIFKTQLSWKMNFLLFGFSFIAGLALDQYFSSPFPFSSYFEYDFYRSSKGKIQNSMSQVQNFLKGNLGNFVFGQLFIRNYIEADPTEKRQLQKDLLPSLLIYWVSKKSLSSLHPMAKTFNQLSLDDIKENFTFYDLNNLDLPWIHDVFRTGCWKIGLYLLDQYLLTNKQSKMYTSSLMWSDRVLTDLKKVSFDEESIENWLMDYHGRFRGTPISTKIQLIYHNKDDWFEKSYRFAAL